MIVAKSEPGAATAPTVLVIEDDAEVRDITCEGLSLTGFHVIAAVDGEQGVAKLIRHRSKIRCILLDLGMPRMSGVEIFRQLRATAPEVPILLTSGARRSTLYPEMREESARFIAKPYRLSDLVKTLRELLSEHEASSDALS
ncbi:MAG: response regulator [Myxococcota bacterium]